MTETKWKAGDWVAVAMQVSRIMPSGQIALVCDEEDNAELDRGEISVEQSEIIGPAKRPIRVGDKVQRWFMTGDSAECREVLYDAGEQMLTRSETGDLRLMEKEDLRHWPIKEGEE